MIDIHHHLLPGFDDGAQDMETSLDMARIAVADGITHVVCTPHANNQYNYELGAIKRRIAELQQRIDAEGIALKLGRGCDFHLTYENIQQAKKDPSYFSVNGLGYLLVEIPDYGLPQGLTDTFYQLQLAGLTPILTHPERNATLQRTPERLQEWLSKGLLIQVTAGSITGNFGGKAKEMAWNLVRSGSVHVLATDAHDLVRRPPRMAEARDLIAKKLGEEYADLLCTQNPLASYEGKPLPPQPALETLRENASAAAGPFWKRLFGRD